LYLIFFGHKVDLSRNGLEKPVRICLLKQVYNILFFRQIKINSNKLYICTSFFPAGVLLSPGDFMPGPFRQKISRKEVARSPI
jgi:hypothetical protein